MVDLDAVMAAVSAALRAYGSGVLAPVENQQADDTARRGWLILYALSRQGGYQAAVGQAVVDVAEHVGDVDALGSPRWQVKKALAADRVLALEVEGLLRANAVIYTGHGDENVTTRSGQARADYRPTSSRREDHRRCPECGLTGPLSSRSGDQRTCRNGHTWFVD